jgi:putative ABC transport system permease protein
MTGTWLLGLLRRQPARIAFAAAGVAVAVALLLRLGDFLVQSEHAMTDRAATGVAIDWQVLVDGGHPGSILRTLTADPRTAAALPVGFADSPGLRARAGGTVQDTGAARVLGLPRRYAATFPLAVRLLTGTRDGPLVAQQTAANLHVRPGDVVRIARSGLPAFRVRVSGVVELPQADSLFQRIGAPSQVQPVAPPDNVVLLPAGRFHRAYDGLSRQRPDLVTTQFHVARDHAALPDSPAAAYNEETGAANNLSVRTAGAATVGNNLGATLDAAREDAAYARILFLFLAVPGAVLAVLLTAAVTAAGAERRRGEQALLRTRGASRRRLAWLAVVEALTVGFLGSCLGLAAALLTGGLAGWFWTGLAVAMGVGVAALVVAVPAIRDSRTLSARAGAKRLIRSRPAWLGYGLDVVLIALGLAVVVLSGQNKYTLVLAPEGVPQVSVSYWAFLGPTLAWLGSGLLVWRLADAGLGRGRGLLGRAVSPWLGSLAHPATSMLGRRRRIVARSTVLLALSVAFAWSTATFNATYRQQAEVDAQLTNGADVTVTESPGATVPPTDAATLARVPGVRAVQPMQHRFAYVGNDLQDFYGIDAATFTRATHLQDAYFQGLTATQAMEGLRSRPDGVLVSAETVTDFQLAPGDLVRLRLQDQRTHRYLTVPFHYVGVVNEFPTAPRDSFIVANAAYVAQRTHSNAVGTFLLDTGGTHVDEVARQVAAVVGTGAHVATINDARGLAGSSLTSVDLSTLTRVELGFALLFAVAAGGLVLALGLAERRRGLALATALGAKPRGVRRLGLTEPLYVLVVGTLTGALAGWGLAKVTVKVLTGVFDPPPSSLAVPWAYLSAVVLAAAASVLIVAGLVVERTRARAQELLRTL